MSVVAASRGRAADGPGFHAAPYLVGAGIGLLSMAVFAIVNAPLGITTALSQVSGGLAALILDPDTLAANGYWRRNPFRLDYGTLFLVGTLAGAFWAAAAAGRLRLETVPETWRCRFGPSVPLRFAAAFVGGIMTIYGARLAGGCTSGHGISGGLQLAVSSWLFLIVMFASGLATAAIVFGRRGGA